MAHPPPWGLSERQRRLCWFAHCKSASTAKCCASTQPMNLKTGGGATRQMEGHGVRGESEQVVGWPWCGTRRQGGWRGTGDTMRMGRDGNPQRQRGLTAPCGGWLSQKAGGSPPQHNALRHGRGLTRRNMLRCTLDTASLAAHVAPRHVIPVPLGSLRRGGGAGKADTVSCGHSCTLAQGAFHWSTLTALSWTTLDHSVALVLLVHAKERCS